MTVRKKYLLASSLLLPLTLLGVGAFGQKGAKKTTPAHPNPPARSKTPAAKNVPVTFEKHISPLVQKYCVSCHGAKSPAADLSLVGYANAASVLKKRDVWEKVSGNISAGHMPPAGMPQLTPAERDLVVGWIDSTISQADCKLDDPGRVTMRRLNREEYNNSVRDLTGLDLKPADDFPSDDVGYGFDNIGDVLSISPLLMDKYLIAAERIARTAIAAPETQARPARFPGSRLDGDGGADFETGGRLLGTERGDVGISHVFPRPGQYLLQIGAFGQQAGPEPVKMAVRLDNKELRVFEVKAEQATPEIYALRVTVPAGKHRFSMAFLNNYRKPDLPPPNDRNLIVDFVEITGPLEAPDALPISHKRIITMPHTQANRIAVARKVLGDFARRAYRRPVSKDEVNRLVRYVYLAEKQGESWERGIQLGVQAVLVSPNFLFRVETNAAAPKNGSHKSALGSYELASRLSYFLWSSMPDEELMRLAATDALQNPKVLAAQAKRMLKDPKAKALADNFGGQWLHLRKLSVVAPDTKVFPNFNDSLRAAMRTETEMFFMAVVANDRSILDFIDGRFTYLNEPLAKHYGIPGVAGDHFRKVALAGDQRRGILTHGSVLTVTSNPTRTSPVKRGKWVLEQILGTPPPPPPPGVAELPDDKKGPLTGTLRQRLEQHRKDAGCASCHARLDPIGFGLENFDAVGAWRVKDGEYDVDSSGTLTDGKSFKGPAQLATILKTKKALFARSFSDKMLTYALGRGVESADRCHVDEIAAELADGDYRFSALVTAVVQSEPFRLRRVEPAARVKPARQAKK